MKATLFTLFICLAAAGCKKCYTCTGYSQSPNTREFCKGSSEYDVLKRNATLTDYNGQEISCK
ncbi:MAG: hypothetical protein KA149_10440 [Chitinophagales bacterium]|nr:hypothetical protein [Chitinophagales bacterium]